ncbi:hypothetical protein T08_5647 [Trichinella sp. T8]|nr:hypothetical protein T08_5647 [Trichinella sp. T8]
MKVKAALAAIILNSIYERRTMKLKLFHDANRNAVDIAFFLCQPWFVICG